MLPELIINLGPLAFALDRLVALGLILTFVAVVDLIAQRWGNGRRYPAMLALGAGMLAARVAAE